MFVLQAKDDSSLDLLHLHINDNISLISDNMDMRPIEVSDSNEWPFQEEAIEVFHFISICLFIHGTDLR